MADEQLIEVWNYPRISLAEVGKYRLDQSGIESEIFGGDVDSYYLTAMGGVSLMVRKADFESAKKVLEAKDDVLEEIVAEEDEIAGAAEFCANCHSKKIRVRKIRHIKSGFFPLDYVKEWFGYQYVLRCRNCKETWKKR